MHIYVCVCVCVLKDKRYKGGENEEAEKSAKEKKYNILVATQKHACEAFHKVASITWRWGWLKGEDLSLIHVNHFAPAHFQKKITLVLNIVFVSIINSFLKDN